jgi:hypothetical protein
VLFGRDELGLDSFPSNTVPELLSLARQDMIFTLSFFYHRPETTFACWLVAWQII